MLEKFADAVSAVVAGETREREDPVSGRDVEAVRPGHERRSQGAVQRGQERDPDAGSWSSSPRKMSISFTTLSEKALLYFEDDFAHKILSMGEAVEPRSRRLQDYLLRELISEGRLRYPVVQKVGDGMVTTTIEKNGPVAFLVTTTQHSLDSEIETRLLSLEIDDTDGADPGGAAQGRRGRRRQRWRAGARTSRAGTTISAGWPPARRSSPCRSPTCWRR